MLSIRSEIIFVIVKTWFNIKPRQKVEQTKDLSDTRWTVNSVPPELKVGY